MVLRRGRLRRVKRSSSNAPPAGLLSKPSQSARECADPLLLRVARQEPVGAEGLALHASAAARSSPSERPRASCIMVASPSSESSLLWRGDITSRPCFAPATRGPVRTFSCRTATRATPSAPSALASANGPCSSVTRCSSSTKLGARIPASRQAGTGPARRARARPRPLLTRRAWAAGRRRRQAGGHCPPPAGPVGTLHWGRGWGRGG